MLHVKPYHNSGQKKNAFLGWTRPPMAYCKPTTNSKLFKNILKGIGDVMKLQRYYVHYGNVPFCGLYTFLSELLPTQFGLVSKAGPVPSHVQTVNSICPSYATALDMKLKQ